MLGGCGTTADSALPDTGSKDCIRAYFEAVIHKDWTAAYAQLHSDSKKLYSASEFARRAELYRTRFGFEPTSVHIRNCEERGDLATAKLELSGSSVGRHHYKEAATLKRVEGEWLIVLPARFGQK